MSICSNAPAQMPSTLKSSENGIEIVL